MPPLLSCFAQIQQEKSHSNFYFSNGSSPVNLKFHLCISFQDICSPSLSEFFIFLCFVIRRLPSHWTVPRLSEILYLFLVCDFILQYLSPFVNSYLQIFQLFLYYQTILILSHKLTAGISLKIPAVNYTFLYQIRRILTIHIFHCSDDRILCHIGNRFLCVECRMRTYQYIGIRS